VEPLEEGRLRQVERVLGACRWRLEAEGVGDRIAVLREKVAKEAAFLGILLG
jgi:hypothetical protein